MAAPTNAANVKKVLVNSEPSTHGTSRHFAAAQQFGRFRTEADIGPDFMSTRPGRVLLEGAARSPRPWRSTAGDPTPMMRMLAVQSQRQAAQQ